MRGLIKYMALAFTLTLVLSCAGAYAENRVVLIKGENGFPGYGAITGVAAAGDVVYVCEYYEETLFVYRTGDEAAAVYAFEDDLGTVTLCAGDDGALYRIAGARSEDGYEIESVGLYRVDLGGDMVARTELIAPLPWNDLIFYSSGAAQSQEVASCLLLGDELYAVCETEDGRRMFRFDPDTGEPADVGIENARELKAYRDGEFLLLRFDANADTAYIEIYDPAAGVAREVTSMGRDAAGNRSLGLCYDAAGDRVLYTYGGAVRARAF